MHIQNHLELFQDIKDANNFDYINSYNRTEVNVNGEAYYVYTLIDTTSVTNFKQIYA